MKKYSIVIIICLIVNFSFAQNVTEYTSYIEAMKTFSKDQKLMVIYFYNGKDSKTQRIIKKEILKPNILKQFGKDIVLLKIDASKEPTSKTYNSRPMTAYNPDNTYPSVKVYMPGYNKRLPLQTIFSPEAISEFLKQIKAL